MRHAALAILLAATTPALASGPPPAASGHAALALGVLLGLHSPLLSSAEKTALKALIADMPPPTQATLTVKAKSVSCRAGDVDIAAWACTLTYGAQTVSLKGRPAHELYATLVENTVPGDGAAGTIYEAVNQLDCVLDVSVIEQKSGGGASCTYTPGP